MGLKNVFKRREYKYLLSEEQYHELTEKLSEYMDEDKYGQTTIMSMYFDTPKYYFINQSIKKVSYKSKFRVRSYGVPENDSPVFLEMKKKIQGIVYKRRLAIPYKTLAPTVESGMRHVEYFEEKNNSEQIEREIKWEFSRYPLEPAVIIANDRLALFGKADPSFRVTFDSNIRFREDDLKFCNGDYGEKIDTDFKYIMEVKATGAYPIWFADIIAQMHLVKGRFSKYGYVYQYYLSQYKRGNEYARSNI